MIAKKLFLALFLVTTSLQMNAKATEELLQTKAKPIEVLLLNALPGSGKSEVRHYLSTLNQQECKEQFGIGETVQLDDFPYVHMMRRISEELIAKNKAGAYFPSRAFCFSDAKSWGTLMHLINEDYDDLVNQKKAAPKFAAQWLFDRLDNASKKAGGKATLSKLPKKLRTQIAKSVETDAAKLLKSKNEVIDQAKNLAGKTVVIEFARGGADSAPMPLPSPYGYKYAFSQLSPQILDKASVLYIWVSPEESRRKNEERADPKDPGSILNHAVPRAVMYGDYGCDDIDWLLNNTSKPSTVEIKAHGKTYNLPLGRFDNRKDKTTFLRGDIKAWKKDNVTNLRVALKDAFAPLVG